MAKALAYGSVSFTKTNVLREDVLNYASLSENSNKFYIMELQEGTGAYQYCVYAEYGRLGKSPRRVGRYFNSLWQAQEVYDKLYREKINKGYHKITRKQDESPFASTVATVKKKNDKKSLSKITDPVLRLIGNLYQEATSYLVKAITTPLGEISVTQVAKGLKILAQIEERLDRGSKDRYLFEMLSDEFYSVIPVVFGNKVDYEQMLIDDYQKLNRQKDLLGVMDSVAKVQDSLEKTLEEKYKALNIELKHLTPRMKDYERVKKMVEGSQSRHHHFDIKIEEIFRIENMVGHDKFNPYKVKTMELFHGSRNENILSIMQNGLKIKPKSAVHTGSMFGAGIYFASDSTKSCNYCWGFSYGSTNQSYYLIVCEVATGKIKDYTHAQPHLTSAPWGYNSVRGVKGPSLLHDEYIVYKESQVKPKYIVQFKRN